MDWFTEILHTDLAQRLRVDKVLYEGQTEFQDAKVLSNGRLGKVLVLDNVVQTTLGDEFVYHEMLAHVPLFSHPFPPPAFPHLAGRKEQPGRRPEQSNEYPRSIRAS